MLLLFVINRVVTDHGVVGGVVGADDTISDVGCYVVVADVGVLLVSVHVLPYLCMLLFVVVGSCGVVVVYDNRHAVDCAGSVAVFVVGLFVM